MNEPRVRSIRRRARGSSSPQSIDPKVTRIGDKEPEMIEKRRENARRGGLEG